MKEKRQSKQYKIVEVRLWSDDISDYDLDKLNSLLEDGWEIDTMDKLSDGYRNSLLYTLVKYLDK